MHSLLLEFYLVGSKVGIVSTPVFSGQKVHYEKWRDCDSVAERLPPHAAKHTCNSLTADFEMREKSVANHTIPDYPFPKITRKETINAAATASQGLLQTFNG